MQSQLDWRLSQTEHDSRYRQCGQDMRELLDWIDRNDPRLNEREAVKLLRRVFEEQFEMVEGKLQPTQRRRPRSVQNPHDPDAHYADKGTKQWIGYKVHVVESVDPEQPIKKKGEPAEHFITEILTTERVVSFTTGARVGIWPPLISGTCAKTGDQAIDAQSSSAAANRRATHHRNCGKAGSRLATARQAPRLRSGI